MVPIYQKHLLFICLCLFTFVYCRADTLTLTAPIAQKTALQDYFSIWEDASRNSDTNAVNRHYTEFQPIRALSPQSPLSYYWLELYVSNATNNAINTALSFNNLTYVDVFLFKNGEFQQHNKIGAFREQKYLIGNDERTHTFFSFAPKETYRILLKVEHTKNYWPVFNFTLQDKDTYTRQLHRKNIKDAWFQGGTLLFFIYTFLSWLISRYRPYIWLLFYIAGISLYGMSSGGYIIDWFFPNNPSQGWMLHLGFEQLGCLGIYLLLMDFWNMKKHNPTLYKVGKMLIVWLILLSLVSYGINAFTGDFKFTNDLNLWAFLFPGGFIIASIWLCWKRLTVAQRYLAYGLILFFAVAITVVLLFSFFKESAIHIVPNISHIATLGVFLFFAIGVKEEFRQHVIEKAILADRNSKIELLINELHHRVKNNLQLLYAMNSLQLTTIQDDIAHATLKGNLGKIKAMMLVNEKLFHFGEQAVVDLKTLTLQLTTQLQSIYDNKETIHIQQTVPLEIALQGKQALPFGLILSELLTNSFKYAFVNHPAPEINIEIFKEGPDKIHFKYADNGVGADIAVTKEKATMGVSLIKDLARQMNTAVIIDNKNGLSYLFKIPI